MEELKEDSLKRMNCKTKQNGSRQAIDYSKYQIKRNEIIWYGLQGLMIQLGIAYIFYDSLFAFLFLMPVGLLFLKEKRKSLCSKQRQKLLWQFKDAILSIVTGLEAGYAIENACKEAYSDMKLLHGKESLICKELFQISRQLENNVNLEVLLSDLGKRSGLQDIIDFAEIFRIAKRSGGNLTEIIRNTVTVILDKIEVKKEIETIVSAKQFEQSIMNVIPFFIIIYITATSPGFFKPLYHNVIGIVIMSFCLMLYMTALVMARKITDISV